MLVVLTSCCPLDNPYYSRFSQLSNEVLPITCVLTINKKSRFDHFSSLNSKPIFCIGSHLNYKSFVSLVTSVFFTSHIFILYNLACVFRSSPNSSLLIYGRSSFYFLFPILFARFRRIPVIIDHTEWFAYSDFSSRFSLLQFIDDFLFRHIVARLASDHISISFSLSLLLSELGMNRISVLLPRFTSKVSLSLTTSKKRFQFNFVYSGSLKPSDDPITLLESIISFASNPQYANSQILLQFSSVPSCFHNLISQLKNFPQVNIRSRLSSHERNELIRSSFCALLTHSNIGGARYNIPSRYNDYILTPAVITSSRLIAEDYICHSFCYGYDSGSRTSLLTAMSKSLLSGFA